MTTNDIDPWLSMTQPFVLLEKSGDGALPIESGNVSNIKAVVTPLDVSEMAKALADENKFRPSQAAQTTTPR